MATLDNRIRLRSLILLIIKNTEHPISTGITEAQQTCYIWMIPQLGFREPCQTQKLLAKPEQHQEDSVFMHKISLALAKPSKLLQDFVGRMLKTCRL